MPAVASVLSGLFLKKESCPYKRVALVSFSPLTKSGFYNSSRREEVPPFVVYSGCLCLCDITNASCSLIDCISFYAQALFSA